MYNYQKVIDLANELIISVKARESLRMQQRLDELDLSYKEEFGDSLDCFEAIEAFAKMNLASAMYFAYNNMFKLVHVRYYEVAERMDVFLSSSIYSSEQKSTIGSIFSELEKVHVATPERHQNRVINRIDSRCCLCRVMPANKTGSHMVPNFLSHPTFSWDGKGKRFHEALNHDFLNAHENNCSFYGREVPEWRFAKGEGKEEVTDKDIEKNINQLEYDNEFCSYCERRFGILESAYSQFYNGQQKRIHPRIAYLFWLSVLWRMSMGSMSIFMEMDDELSLRKLLDDNILDTVQNMERSGADIGGWKYAIFRANGLKDGDKGILGYRKECSPYVVMYNDLVMVFFHCDPEDFELSIGPINVKREMLNDWHSPEKTTPVDRRWFWNVRDWFVESDYDYYDPVREKTLISIREKERSDGRIISERIKEKAIKIARLSAGPQEKLMRIRKMERIWGAWIRKNEAKAKCLEYDPLNDEELFLQQRDFDMYFHDLVAMSRDARGHKFVEEFPFYEQARETIPDSAEWEVKHEDDGDTEYENAMMEFMKSLSEKELDHLVNGVKEPYVNPFASVGRNDLCPCGSGKKYKKCCGK